MKARGIDNQRISECRRLRIGIVHRIISTMLVVAGVARTYAALYGRMHLLNPFEKMLISKIEMSGNSHMSGNLSIAVA